MPMPDNATERCVECGAPAQLFPCEPIVDGLPTMVAFCERCNVAPKLARKTYAPGFQPSATPAPIVVPFIKLHPATEAALEPYGDRVQYVEVSDYGAYWELFSSLWARGDDFIVIEHDIEPRPDTIESFDACPAWWCTAPYPYRERPGSAWGTENVVEAWGSLGCVRFRAELIREVPELAGAEQLRAAHPEIPDRPFHYAWVDYFAGGVLRHDHGKAPCLHDRVQHHQDGAPIGAELVQ